MQGLHRNMDCASLLNKLANSNAHVIHLHDQNVVQNTRIHEFLISSRLIFEAASVSEVEH